MGVPNTVGDLRKSARVLERVPRVLNTVKSMLTSCTVFRATMSGSNTVGDLRKSPTVLDPLREGSQYTLRPERFA